MPRLRDLDDVRARLERDRHWSAFSLADLDPPYAAHAHWFGPPQGDEVVLVYDAFDPPIVFIQGAEARCEAVLADADVVAATPSAWLNVQPAHLPLVARVFRSFGSREMVRMVLDRDRFAPVELPGLVRLGPPDISELDALYADDRPAFFLPSQLHSGVYHAVRNDSRLVAVAGTHVVSRQAAVAALGNVYTRPECRGRGYGAGVTSAVTQELLWRGITTVVLNIVATNSVARRVYERLGFREYCVYYEGLATR
jgi:RimJ/RimL family protein N-acetyltransferase